MVYPWLMHGVSQSPEVPGKRDSYPDGSPYPPRVLVVTRIKTYVIKHSQLYAGLLIKN